MRLRLHIKKNILNNFEEISILSFSRKKNFLNKKI